MTCGGTRRFDVVFSSSVLQWVADHPAFLRGAEADLHSGGRLVAPYGGKGNTPDFFVALRPEMLKTMEFTEPFLPATKARYAMELGNARADGRKTRR
ncbi:MAG: methyltransferase domain-containing protein [Verrucomicrobiia bacterium]|jgi:trans-aconitate methyltransferase